MANPEQVFVDLINANPDDTTAQLIYADWLDEQGDPRGEGWRVLIERGRKPDLWEVGDLIGWNWDWGDESTCHFFLKGEMWDRDLLFPPFERFFDAMHAAVIAYVKCYLDPDFECPHQVRV